MEDEATIEKPIMIEMIMEMEDEATIENPIMIEMIMITVGIVAHLRDKNVNRSKAITQLHDLSHVKDQVVDLIGVIAEIREKGEVVVDPFVIFQPTNSLYGPLNLLCPSPF